MQSGPKQLIDAVCEQFGPRAAVTDPAAVAPWLTDWRGHFHGRASGILAPGSTEQVAAMVVLAARHSVPLVPQGGNTSMVGGATPPEDGTALILSLRRMNGLRAIDAPGNLAVAEAGMILEDLHNRAAEVGRRFPLTLGARGSCTIGGLIATNAGGTQVLKFGTMRSLVAGIEAVLPDGSIYNGLTALKKDNRGYSLDQLLIGSEGTLGIITAAALKLSPAVAARAVAWAGVRNPDAALELLRVMQAQTGMIEGFEIIPGDALGLVLDHIAGTRSPLASRHPWHVLIEAASADAQLPSAELERLLADALARGLVADAAIATSEAQAHAFWRIRDSISEAERAGGTSLAHDISVPVADMPRFMTAAAAEVERAFPGVVASAFGHLGDGNVHFHVRLGDAGADPAAVTAMVHDLVTAAGGSISAEHGIGQMKLAEFERLAPPGRIAALHAIKRALDPLGLMNPGKLLR
jgi:FAD/FMN-containing dehydrogenase